MLEEVKDDMNLANITEKQAKLVRETMATLVSDQLLIRKFENINWTYIDKLAEILRFRTSLTNEDNGKRHYTVTDPLVNNQKKEGLWRSVSVTVDKTIPRQNAGTITQVLALGYAQSLVATEARLVGGPWNSIEPIKTLRRQYVALDKEYLGSILETAFESDFVKALVIEGKTYEGKWRKTRNDPSRADDGSGILTQTLVLGWVASEDSLPTPILLTDDKLLLSPFIHDTTSVANIYTWEYRGVDPDYAQTLRNTISLTSGVKSADVVKASDGSCSIRVTTESRTWAGTLSHKWGYNEVHVGFNAQRIVTRYSHIPEDSLAGFRTTLETADTNYKVASLEDTASGEGFYDIVQTQQRMFIGAVTADDGVDIKKDLAVGLLALLTDGAVITTMWLEVPDSDIATAMITLETPPSGYTVTGLSNAYNGTGSANITRVMVTEYDSTAIELAINWPTFDSERKTYAYLGLDKASAETLRTDLQTDVDAGYKVDAVTIRGGIGGSLTVVQNISKLISAVNEGAGITTGYEYEYWGDSEIITTVWLHVADADHVAALTTLATAPFGYTTTRIADNFNGTGACDIIRTIVKENSTGMEVGIVYPSFAGERMTFVYLGLDKTDAETLYTTLQTTLSGGLSSTIYKIDSVDIPRGVHGTLSVTQRVSKTNAAGSETSRIQAVRHTDAFGLVDRTTTILLNVQYAQLATAKATIEADATKIILEIGDNDNGSGAANIVYTWRAIPSAPVSMGALASEKPTPYSQQTDERTWIDVTLTDADSLKDAVALALAGTDPYTVEATETILSAFGRDSGDGTGRIGQRVRIKPSSYTYADYKTQVAINPHGLKEAVMESDVREYLDVNVADMQTIFDLLKTFLGDPMKGRIICSLNRGKGTLDFRGIKEGTPDWDNTTPDYVIHAKGNVGGRQPNKTSIATGVPVEDSAAIVAAVTAEASHALDSVQFVERGQGEGVITKRETEEDNTAILTKEGAGNFGRSYKETTWFDILPTNVATAWTTAETHNVAGNLVLDYRILYRPVGGLATIIQRVGNAISSRNDTTTIHGADTHTLLDIDRTPCSTDVDELGYRWRKVTITVSDIRTQTRSTAQDHISTGDKDSFYRKDGRYRWSIVWFGRKISRVFGSWELPSTTSENTYDN